MAQWNPLHDLVSLQDRMNRLFEDASRHRAAEAGVNDELESPDWYPASDVYEIENEYIVAIDLPGIDRSSLDISVDDNRLTIRGSRPEPEATLHRSECPRGTFLRTFSIPSQVDQQSIEADYKDGILRVHLSKRAERKPQRVEIKVS